MTDHLTDEAVKALLDGATPDWCIYSEPEVGLPPGFFAGKIGQAGFGPLAPMRKRLSRWPWRRRRIPAPTWRLKYQMRP